MKTMKLTLVLFVALIMITAIPALAFHNGSQLVCNNCHTMHYSEGGQIPSQAEGYPQNADSGGPFDNLLVKANISDLCLQCHRDNAYSGAPSVFNTNPASALVQLPGGDFGYAAPISSSAKPGQSPGGHIPFGSAAHPSTNFPNPSPDGGATGLTPPGGTAMSSFQCTDCHGVHGPESGSITFSNASSAKSYQTYAFRLLSAVPNGYNTVASDSIQSHAWIVSGGAVVAGPDGADLTISESSTNHNVYKGGFSNWCASCHPNFHSDSNTDSNVYDSANSAYIRHPTNVSVANIRGTYKKGAAYNYAYPLVKVDGTWTNTGGGNIGADGADTIMCLSCHQAHATANPNALRWDPSQASASGQCNFCHGMGGGV